MGQLTRARRPAWAIAFGALLLAGQLVLLVHASSGLSHDPSCPVCQVAHKPAMSSPILPLLPLVVHGDPPRPVVDASPAFQPPIAPSQRGPPAVNHA